MIVMAVAGTVNAATQEAIQQSIDDGLAWLATAQSADGHWEYGGTREDVAATSSALLALIEEGHYMGSGTAYEAQVTNGVNWLFNRAYTQAPVWETAGYSRHAEDYNGNLALDDGGNNRMVYFGSTDVYSNGITAPVVYALGEKLGVSATVTTGALAGETYGQVMQDVVDWFSFGQVEPNRGNQRGGWRYYPNYSSSDNSTAQWGSLPMLYANDPAWGLQVPDYVKNELSLWTDYIQNPVGGDWQDGGSGYSNPTSYVNMAKTGGMLLQFAAEGKALSHTDVQNALDFMQSMQDFDHWNQTYHYSSSQWYGGNIDNAYAMWAVFKGLEVYGGLIWDDNGTPLDLTDDFLVGDPSLISTAPGGFTIGYSASPDTSVVGDWYSHYCDFLVNDQNLSGSWSGNYPWTGALATGWYINILNATGAPPVIPPIPVPGAFLLGGIGLAFAGRKLQRRKEL
ncbi:MAG TPA: hypothetical protein DIU00_11535 [Phycisphaerales bacterium]|nr:hypothetical protein [Phycisphaerales bacterium]